MTQDDKKDQLKFVKWLKSKDIYNPNYSTMDMIKMHQVWGLMNVDRNKIYNDGMKAQAEKDIEICKEINKSNNVIRGKSPSYKEACLRIKYKIKSS